MLGSLLPKELKTCLYLDVDMLALGDLRQCFALSLKDKILAVVWVEHTPFVTEILKSTKNQADFVYPPEIRHFNTGFMLINLEKWRDFEVEQKSIKFLQDYVIERIPDENTLNAVISENLRLILPLRFNAFVGFLACNKNLICLDEKDKKNNDMQLIIPYTKEDIQKGREDALILHFIWTRKAWQVCDITQVDKSLYQYHRLWWDMALQTPIFDKELLLLKTEVQDRFLRELINQKESEIKNRLNAQKAEYETKIAAQRQEYLHSLKECENKLLSAVNLSKFELLSLLEPRLASAVVRVKNQLSYKLGSAIIKYSKNFGGNLILPFVLFKVYLAHKKEVRIYKERVFYNPNLKLPLLERYTDFNEALKVKDHLSYKLGQAFIKGLKTWYKFGLIKFYFEAKRLERV